MRFLNNDNALITLQLFSKHVQSVLDRLYQRTNFETRQRSVPLRDPCKTDLLELLRLLGQPHKSYKTVHLAGTKGKGSTAHYVALYLVAAGYRTGLYMSPSVIDLRDRFFVNMKQAQWKDIIPLISRIEDLAEKKALSLTVFDVLTAVAFLHFRNLKVDYAVIETGLGGRFDSTNVIDPEAALITTIGLDHTEQLGHTLSKIAFEKAGIIKRGKPVYFTPQEEEVNEVIVRAAKKMHAPLTLVNAKEDMQTDGLGMVVPFQADNLRLARAAIHGLGVPYQSKAFLRLFRAYPIKGRFYRQGKVLYDGAHNVTSMKRLVEAVRFEHHKAGCLNATCHVICYFLPGKNVEEIMDFFPIEWKISYYDLALTYIPIRLQEDVLRRVQQKRSVAVHKDLSSLRRSIGSDEYVIVTGSFRLVGYLMKHDKAWNP